MREPIRLFSLILALALLALNSCQKKKKNINEINKTVKEYKYIREFIKYDLDNNITQDIEIYINKNKDTLGFQKITYNNNVIDSTNSRFYGLTLYRESKLFGGKLTYHFDSLKDGKLADFSFSVVSNHSNKTDFVDFKDYDFKNNSLEFSFEHDNDTLMGLIYAQHTKDTIENGENKVRIREVLLPIDNYNETNNPFVDIKL